jgi:hypothetical protein
LEPDGEMTIIIFAVTDDHFAAFAVTIRPDPVG